MFVVSKKMQKAKDECVCVFQKRDHAELALKNILGPVWGGQEARRRGHLYFYSQRGCANRALTEWRGGTVHMERA